MNDDQKQAGQGLTRKILHLSPIALLVLMFLSIGSHSFTPFLLAIPLAIMLSAILSKDWVDQALQKLLAPPPPKPPTYYYQPKHPVQPPPQQSSSPLKPGFHLTAEEYRDLSRQYDQGYQGQTPTSTTERSPFTPPSQKSGQPKQDRSIDYEQPQAQYPEQTPPMQQ